MSCDGPVCGHGGLFLFPAPAPAQDVIAQGAAFEAAERDARMTLILTDTARTQGLPTRVAVPANLGRKVTARS